MERQGVFERQRLQRIVEMGRLHASERPSVCDDLRQRIRRADVIPVDGLGRLFQAQPPSADLPHGRIEYDPALLATLAAEHTYPEWVVSAHLEILIQSRLDEWHGRPIPSPLAAGPRRPEQAAL